MLRIIFMTLVLVAFVSCKGKTDNTQNKVAPTNSTTEVSKPTEMPIASTEEKDVITSDNMSSLQFGKCKIDGNFEKSIIDCEDTIDEFKFIYKNGTKAKRFLASDLPSDENGKIRFLKLNDHAFEVYGLGHLSEVKSIEVLSNKKDNSVVSFQGKVVVERYSYADQTFTSSIKDGTIEKKDEPKDPSINIFKISNPFTDFERVCSVSGNVNDFVIDCNFEFKVRVESGTGTFGVSWTKENNRHVAQLKNLPRITDFAIISVRSSDGRVMYYELSFSKGNIKLITIEEMKEKTLELQKLFN